MLAATYPLQVLLMTFSGLVNRHQADIIAYLVEENRVLKEQMKGRALRLNDDQRRSSKFPTQLDPLDTTQVHAQTRVGGRSCSRTGRRRSRRPFCIFGRFQSPSGYWASKTRSQGLT